MKIRAIFIAHLLLALPFGLSAQTYRLLEGRVSHSRLPLEGIHVINASRGNAEITDVNGEFEISIALGERLLFSGVQFKQRELIITEAIFSLAEVTVYLEEFVNELKEVVVKPHDLSGSLSSDLSAVPKQLNFSDVGIPGFKGEREEKIVSAKSLILSTLLLPISGGINLEAAYKHLSGYYKKLKKKRKLEGEFEVIFSMIKFYGVFFFEQEYGLPQEKVYDFVLSCSENTNIIKFYKMGMHEEVTTAFDRFNRERYAEN
ncbi:carboxypeptidase-like regulatory domain-containing protein [Flavobacteriaceae bacterium]|nr:carboxypeptidase-like regulatory domain-containing protein [Flavobacteriaceae bacterium]